jgi:hypothetical protein
LASKKESKEFFEKNKTAAPAANTGTSSSTKTK